MKNTTQSFWDRIASTSRGTSSELHGTALKTAEATQRYLTGEQIVLDYGCGAGELTLALAQKAKAVHGIDTSPGMIEAARARADQQGAENVHFAHSTIDGIARQAGMFHIVTAFNVLHYIEDTQEVSRRISNLLSPGGLFISSTACVGGRRTVMGALVLALARLRIMPAVKFFTEHELENLIARGGFQIITTERLSTLPDYFIVAKKLAGSGQ